MQKSYQMSSTWLMELLKDYLRHQMKNLAQITIISYFLD